MNFIYIVVHYLYERRQKDAIIGKVVCDTHEHLKNKHTQMGMKINAESKIQCIFIYRNMDTNKHMRKQKMPARNMIKLSKIHIQLLKNSVVIQQKTKLYKNI